MTVGVQICSGAEWRAITPLLGVGKDALQPFPYGEFVETSVAGHACVFFTSRRTKTRAAGACQYAIDHWRVDPVLVLGTCGGVGEHLRERDLIVATRTLQYDCDDARPGMGRVVTADPAWLDLAALGDAVHPGVIACADRDLTFDGVAALRKEQVLGADWESGAIAHVCELNRVRWTIVRGITDVPRDAGPDDERRQRRDYEANTPAIMATLVERLPRILGALRRG